MLLHRLADAAFWAALLLASLAPFGAARAGLFALGAVAWELLSRRPAWFDTSGLDAIDWPRLGALAARQVVTVTGLFLVMGSGLAGTLVMLPGLQGGGLARLLGWLHAVPFWASVLVALAALAGLAALARPARAR